MNKLFQHLLEARNKRFLQIAKIEATPEGYRKYREITHGPILNGLLIILTGLIAPFYVLWRGVVGLLAQGSEKAKLLAAFLVFLLVLFVAYSNHFDNEFQFDDMHSIVHNEFITDIRNIPRFFWDINTNGTLPQNQSYRPVVTTLNAIDYWIGGGLNPKVFHWHIFLEFVVLLVILLQLFRAVFEATNVEFPPLLPLLSTAFFALHTATAETVNYIIARSDGFSTLMVVTGFLVFIRFQDWRKHIALVPFVVGCFTKPTTLMLAPILAVYTLLLGYPSVSAREDPPSPIPALTRAFRETWPYFVLGGLLYLFTRSMFSEDWTPGGNFTGLEYLNTQAFVIWIYLKTFILPTGLTADTDIEVIRQILAPRVLWGLFVIGALLLVAWKTSRSRKTLPITFGILWFFIALIPSSSIIPLAEVMNHHRTFFPYIGLVMAVSWAAYLGYRKLNVSVRSSRWTALFVVMVAVILGAHAWGTHQRNEVWDNPGSLWKDVTEKSPNNGRGLMNYGLSLMAQGHIEQAIEQYEKALNTGYGRHPYLFVNLGIATNALAEQQDSDELLRQAEQFFQTAIQLGQRYPQTHYRYAAWLLQQGRSDEALAHVNRALELAPALGEAKTLRQNLLASDTLSITSAIDIANQENTAEAFLNLSLKFYNLGQFEDSIEAAESSLALKPDYPLAFNNICSARIKLQQYDLAIRACERALALNPEFDLARNNLQWATEQKKAATDR
jgi:Tfp pilus assembly protein PilF